MNITTIRNAMIKKAEDLTHTVTKGQNLSGIGKQYGVPWKSIADANKLTAPYTIKPDQKLTIPGKTAQSATGPVMYNGQPVKVWEGKPFTRRDGYMYTIKAGDKGSKLALQHGMRSFDRMKNAEQNKGVNWDKLQIGQKVYIPASDRQWVMEQYGYDPATAPSDAAIREAAFRISKRESGYGDNLRATGSTGSGWHHMLDSLFSDTQKRNPTMFKGWKKADLDDQTKSTQMAEQAIRDFIYDWQYKGKGLIPADMRPAYAWWRKGWGGMNDKDAQQYADELINQY